MKIQNNDDGNLCNSSKNVVGHLEKIIGAPVPFIEGDVRNTELLVDVMRNYHIESVMHFAGLKAVGESVNDPILYYSNNVQGTISLLQAMQRTNIKNLIFSSSATVYGEPVYLPYDELHPTRPINPYGETKLQIEVMLKSLTQSDSEWAIVSLRYFNPVGAHHSGLIGDDPNGVPGNLMPYLARSATGSVKNLKIFGQDFDTPDGTGERDYIHVIDLAEGHMAALDFLRNNTHFHVFNLGTGKSTSVLECVRAFEHAANKNLPFDFAPRRNGDLPVYYAKVDLAAKKLGWRAKRTLREMCESGWHFQEIQDQLNAKKEQ